MPYRNPEHDCWRESIKIDVFKGNDYCDTCVEWLHTYKNPVNGCLDTFGNRLFYPYAYKADGTIAGLLPAPAGAATLNRFKQVVPEIESLLNEYIAMYNELYDADCAGQPLYTSADVDAADEWGRENAYFVGRLCDYRQDLFSSDREIVALYFAMSCEPGVRKAQPKPAPKPVVRQTSGKNANPASRTLKFPFAKDLIIDGENVGKCTEIQEYEKVYNFVTTYNGVFQCRKADKIASTGFDIKVTTTH